MRFLTLDGDGLRLTTYYGNPPPYAILSHTWGSNEEEVSFKDLWDGSAQGKEGYRKIRFCARQAAADGLAHFWIDTCCIDKSNSTELSEALNSMFRWYRDANRCYVYMSDVSAGGAQDSGERLSPSDWESAFRQSRWFTRSWTLQELLAPQSVEFFDSDGHRLGDKQSLQSQVQEITEISAAALQGGDLTNFSVEERMSWANHRQATRDEDHAYALLGIFDVYMPPIYGEGRRHALRRLRKEIEEYAREEAMALSTVSYSQRNASIADLLIHADGQGDVERKLEAIRALLLESEKTPPAEISTVALDEPRKPREPRNQLKYPEHLGFGEMLVSENGRFRFENQKDGNLVLYDREQAGGLALWASATCGDGGDRIVVMQDDGNLVMMFEYNRWPIWSTCTGDRGDASSVLVMQDDGNAVISSGGREIWRSDTGQSAITEGSSNTLRAGEALGRDHTLCSESGRYRLIMQADRNLVLYDKHDNYRVRWASFSETESPIDPVLKLGVDGSLVVVDGGNEEWSSETAGDGDESSVLVVQDDGNVVIYSRDAAIWDTGTWM